MRERSIKHEGISSYHVMRMRTKSNICLRKRQGECNGEIETEMVHNGSRLSK